MDVLTGDNSIALMRAAERQVQQAADIANKAKTVRNFEQIDQAAQEFEAVFITEMIKPMFEGVKPDPTFGGGKGEEVFKGFMLQEYGKSVASAGGIGIAEHVRNELLRIQEEAQNDLR